MARLAFRDMPIAHKLLMAALLTTGIALFCFTSFSLVKETSDWYDTKITDMASDADIVNEDAARALRSGDRSEIEHRLSSLWATGEVAYGAVYKKDGGLFAEAGNAPAGLRQPGPSALRAGSHISRSGATVFAPVRYQGQELGTLYFVADYHDLFSDMLSDTMVTLVAAFASLALAAFFFFRLRPRIVDPIVELTGTMQHVARSKNYDIRVTPQGKDEIGAMAGAFNSMLAAVHERDVKLAEHQHELERTVEARTAELRQANARLQSELSERKVAEAALHAHDRLLKSVARSAAELLGTINLDDAIAMVMGLMGQTLGASRVLLTPVRTGGDGRYWLDTTQEWHVPGRPPLMTRAAFHNVDVTNLFPNALSAASMGEHTVIAISDMPQPFRDIYSEDGQRTMLVIPVAVDRKLWGAMLFLDSSPQQRSWGWAETDTLTTLSNLLSAAISRARSVRELADANTIVQNSPTVLYRLKGEPTLPLTYISHNITKFGYDPKKLTVSANFFQTLVAPEDLSKVEEAMERIMERNAAGATIEFRLIQPGGTFRWVENRYTPIRDETGRLVEVEGIIIDITERKAAEEKIAQLARTDALTGLANRATFVERLHQSFVAAKRGAPRFAVLYLDLDHFKDINDTRGHPVGDELLRQAGERLKQNIRETDLVARLGGDEFAVLQSDIGDPSDAGALASKIGVALAGAYRIGASDIHITASIGISYFMPDTANPDDMLAQADLALYRAKEEGRNQYRFHSADLDHQVAERVAMADELRRAIENDEIEVYYQPQVELHSGQIVGMEALVRWHHPRRGLLMPALFIPTAEKTGTILAIGHRVLQKACEQMKRWREAGLAPPVMSVNVSLAQLKTGPQLVREIVQLLAEYRLAPGDLELDVTESMLAQATLAQNDVLDRLRQAGVRIALDNFGAEYSTFDYLRTYRVNHLKVARKFVEKATEDPQRAATIRAIIGAAREMGIQVIAEGVETQEQRALLVSIGSATRGAGFFFSEAVPAGAATDLLKKGVIDRADKTAAE
ncbi:MAG TPA: EAL domain-containing protein [Rhizomicrobium sp.]|nr:EAL domain-containing protein [Rhizomicrobium sp.]